MTKTIAMVGSTMLLHVVCAVIPASAQPLGSFRWQLQPYCNVITLAVVQQGAQYQLDGTDDQCGAAQAASVRGLAFFNPTGLIGFGLTIITTPGGAPVHVDATISSATLSGEWRDSAGNSGSFVFTPGAAVPGAPRPLPARVAVSNQLFTGQLSERYVANSGFTVAGSSFPLPLPPGTPIPLVEYVPGAPTVTCPGIGQAPPGRLCIYGYNTSNIASVASSGDGDSGGLNRLHGFSIDILPSSSAGSGFFLASWAYRVP